MGSPTQAAVQDVTLAHQRTIWPCSPPCYVEVELPSTLEEALPARRLTPAVSAKALPTLINWVSLDLCWKTFPLDPWVLAALPMALPIPYLNKTYTTWAWPLLNKLWNNLSAPSHYLVSSITCLCHSTFAAPPILQNLRLRRRSLEFFQEYYFLIRIMMDIPQKNTKKPICYTLKDLKKYFSVMSVIKFKT